MTLSKKVKSLIFLESKKNKSARANLDLAGLYLKENDRDEIISSDHLAFAPDSLAKKQNFCQVNQFLKLESSLLELNRLIFLKKIYI
jgi:hypothetical protein